MSSVLIARAGPADLPACVALLPAIGAHDSVCIVARDAAGVLVGAGGIAWRSWGEPPGFPAWLTVLPDRRRQGIGLRLARALMDLIEGEAPALWGVTAIDLEGPAGAFARAAGFVVGQRQFTFRADSRRFLAMIDDVEGRLRARGRIPEGARAEPLSADNAADAATLAERHAPSAPPALRRMIHAALAADPATAAVDLPRSTVLTLDGRPVGALLSQRMPDGVNSRIVINVVAPEVRHGWANAMLLRETTARGVADGSVWFDFDCAEHVRDTIGLARRAGADLIRTDGLFRQAARRAPD